MNLNECFARILALIPWIHWIPIKFYDAKVAGRRIRINAKTGGLSFKFDHYVQRICKKLYDYSPFSPPCLIFVFGGLLSPSKNLLPAY